MAMKPAVAAADPADDETATTGAADAGDDMDTPAAGGADDEMGDEGADETVLVTITKAADGTGYVVYAGDEPEDDESGEGDDDTETAAAGETGDDTGAAPAAGAEPTDEDESEGQHCDSLGAALKAAMDILKEDEEKEGGESGDDQFKAGFAGGSDASPPKPALSQKY